MFIVLIVAAMIAMSAGFVMLSQYTMGYYATTAAYCAFMIIAVAVLYLYMKKKRDDEVYLIENIIGGLKSEEELSDRRTASIYHRFNTAMKSLEAASEKTTLEKNNISALISDISHQIKTPLSNIILYTDMLAETGVFSETQQSSELDNIRLQTERLDFLIDALIKMSRCETGLIAENVRAENNSVTDLIAKSVSDIYPAAAEKGIKFEVDCAGASSVTAYFDMKWTAEAMVNILDNAVKYSPRGRDIVITAAVYDIYVRVDIADTGIGMSDEDLQNVCKRFYRGKNGAVAEEKGVGIGLYLTQMILSEQKGYLKIASELGRGSVFSVFLPRG
jgi:Signal transduction histidine kinase